MSGKLLDSMRVFRRRHPKWKPEHSDQLSYFVCVGYYLGLPYSYASEYALAGENVTNTPSLLDLTQKPLQTHGWTNVCTEITDGNAPTHFSILKRDPSVVNYRKAFAVGGSLSISTHDLLRVSRICLEATGTPEGMAFDHDAQFVGPPNPYAVIDEREGFKWVDPPSR
jgi:hypothetical protein